MTYKIETFHALCNTRFFSINGKPADEWDFGHGEDLAPEKAEPYACGNRQFIIDEGLKPKACKKYKITESEFDEIAAALVEKLSFGACGWCV